MLSQLLSNRVEKTPATDVSADRYQFLALSEAEPDLGVPSGNGYLLTSTTAGARSWVDPATNLTAPGSNTQVIFNNSGVLAGAAGLVYDTATGRVGIGNTPLQALDVAGNISLRNSTASTNLYVHNTYTDASNYERAVIGWSANVLQIGTEAAGTGTVRNINLAGGNVGVNNSSPAQKLSVVGGNISIDRGQTFGVQHLGVFYGIIGLNSANKRIFGDLASNTGTRVGLDAPGISLETNNNPIYFRNGALGAQNAILTSDGKFGLGAVTPSATLDVAGDIEVNSNVNLNSESTTLATTTKTQVASFPVASFRSGKLVVQAYDSVTGEVQISELLVAHNGSTASATEYGVVYTGASSIVTYDVDISGVNVRLMATRSTANSTQYKISETLMVA